MSKSKSITSVEGRDLTLKRIINATPEKVFNRDFPLALNPNGSH